MCKFAFNQKIFCSAVNVPEVPSLQEQQATSRPSKKLRCIVTDLKDTCDEERLITYYINSKQKSQIMKILNAGASTSSFGSSVSMSSATSSSSAIYECHVTDIKKKSLIPYDVTLQQLLDIVKICKAPKKHDEEVQMSTEDLGQHGPIGSSKSSMFSRCV